VRLKEGLSSYTVAFLFASSLAFPADAQTHPGSSPTAVVDVSTIRIDNFGRINSAYFRGAQPKEQDYADLAALGVKMVVNLTSDDADATERAHVENAGMHYMQIPMTTHAAPTSAELTAFLNLVNDPVNQPVYVHCVGGRHRTGVMTAAYRMTHDGWTADQAFKEMKQFKFGSDLLHPEFKQFVYGYPAAHANAAPTATANGAPVGR
jgi:protein tyrosine phosphatase (PTP) superfamily phosphohydrolase (DUF442 family)